MTERIAYSDPKATIYQGDCLDVLPTLPEKSVHCCITSPPYWGLRDYGTASWEGGDAGCDHAVAGQVEDNKATGAITCGVRPGCDASICRKCGARRIDSQLGLEATPEEVGSDFLQALEQAPLIIITVRASSGLPPGVLEDAVRRARPPVAIVPEALGGPPLPDVEREVLTALGVDS